MSQQARGVADSWVPRVYEYSRARFQMGSALHGYGSYNVRKHLLAVAALVLPYFELSRRHRDSLVPGFNGRIFGSRRHCQRDRGSRWQGRGKSSSSIVGRDEWPGSGRKRSLRAW